MKYEFSEEWTAKAREIASALGFKHINAERIACVRSTGSKTRRVIARVHSTGKAMQTGMREKAFYSIELVSEKFDRLSMEDKVKTLIHELMHIPASFGGGFRSHKQHVTRANVDCQYDRYINRRD